MFFIRGSGNRQPPTCFAVLVFSKSSAKKSFYCDLCMKLRQGCFGHFVAVGFVLNLAGPCSGFVTN